MTSKEVQQKIDSLDALLDTDISDAEYDAIEKEIRELHKVLAKVEKKERLLSVPVVYPTKWESEFLNSFSNTVKITRKQLNILERINTTHSKNALNDRQFRYDGKVYSYTFYNQNFGCLCVEPII